MKIHVSFPHCVFTALNILFSRFLFGFMQCYIYLVFFADKGHIGCLGIIEHLHFYLMENLQIQEKKKKEI
jgi:hypothetical protein